MELTVILNKAFDDPETKQAMIEEYDPPIKSEEIAKQGRDVGNKLYLETMHYDLNHERIWDSYLKSISLSPGNSESLATSYGNMSALLYHLAKLEACIENCDKALKITESIPLTIKLLCRKAKCYASLNEAEVGAHIEKAEAWWNKINDNDERKEELAKLLDKTKTFTSIKKLQIKR